VPDDALLLLLLAAKHHVGEWMFDDLSFRNIFGLYDLRFTFPREKKKISFVEPDTKDVHLQPPPHNVHSCNSI
jgi:hypothetical protein